MKGVKWKEVKGEIEGGREEMKGVKEGGRVKGGVEGGSEEE